MKPNLFRLIGLALIVGLAGWAAVAHFEINLSPSEKVLLQDARYNGSSRQISPKEFIAWLRTHRYTHGELDNIPQFAIIVHHADLEAHLKSIGIPASAISCLDIGETDPSKICRVNVPGRAMFVVSRGMPGSGGVTTETAELAALGVKYVVHIGTCGLLGSNNRAKTIVSLGSYKDAAAVLLSTADELSTPIASPDSKFTSLLYNELGGKTAVIEGYGYTIPIFYYQPIGLIDALIQGNVFSSPRPMYIEMEDAPFFQAARISHIDAASIIIPSDIYRLEGKKVKHDWLGDTSKAEQIAIKATWQAFDQIAKKNDEQ